MVVAVAIIGAFLMGDKIDLPIVPSKPVTAVHDAIDALEPGDAILASLDFDPASAPELEPMTRAVLRHCFSKGLRVIGMTHWPAGIGLADQLIKQTVTEFDDVLVRYERFDSKDAAKRSLDEWVKTEPGLEKLTEAVKRSGARVNPGHGTVEQVEGEPLAWSLELRAALAQLEQGASTIAELPDGWYVLRAVMRAPTLTYGEDYCFLGQRAGAGILIITMGQSLYAAFPVDNSGNSTRQLPILKDVGALGDLDYLICIASGNTGESWIAYGAERYGFDMGIGCTAVIAPDLYPFYQAKQISGIIGGIKGAWEYEHLVKIPGKATEAVPAQTVAHMLVIALVLLCNVGYFLGGRKKTAA
jgi:hypothetical protein